MIPIGTWYQNDKIHKRPESWMLMLNKKPARPEKELITYEEDILMNPESLKLSDFDKDSLMSPGLQKRLARGEQELDGYYSP